MLEGAKGGVQLNFEFFTADVFTSEPFGGNPLAVFPRASGLDATTMQRIAHEFGLSETVFVFPPENPRHARKVRIFTPKKELPFAGHPTVGTALVLCWSGEVRAASDLTEVTLEEGIGPVTVRVFLRDGRAARAEFSSPQLPQLGPSPGALEDVAAVLSLAPGDLSTGAAGPRAISCGVPFVFAQLATREALSRARLNRDVWASRFAGRWAQDFYLFTSDTRDPAIDVAARMFGPGVGIEEDPASGSAAAALAGFLAELSGTRGGALKWTIEQGRDLGRPSTIELEADVRDAEVVAVRVRGSAVEMTRGLLAIGHADRRG